VTVEGLSPSKVYQGLARKPGFEVISFTLENRERTPTVAKHLTMVREAGAPPPKPEPTMVKPEPKPEAKPEPKVAKVEPKPEPKGEPKPEAKPEPKVAKVEPKPEPKGEPKAAPKGKAMGKLACNTTPTGAEIFVDGKNTGKKTPLPKSQALDLPVGTHKVTFKFAGKMSAPQTVEIKEDEVAIVKQEL
jgi:outer membrane biosynthesis protein TonB